MAGIPHDHYEPRTEPERWVEGRLPLIGLIYNTLMIPTPKNLNWMWIWGIVLSFTLVLQIVTGIVLAMHYTPHVDLAFASVEHIMRNVNGGHMLRYVHSNGASLFFVAVYAHIFRNLYYGSYKTPREITWIIGMLLYVLMMATAFMGYVLPWGQMSFWGATVITGLFGAIPFVGAPSLQTWLLGGPAVDNATLNRFFSLHYLHAHDHDGPRRSCTSGRSTRRATTTPRAWRCGAPPRAEAARDTLPFWPYFVIKDFFALAVIVVAFFAIVGFMPNYLGHPDNYIEANPLGDARAHRARMVLPALLRDPARLHRRGLGGTDRVLRDGRHRGCQVLRSAGDVRRHRRDGAGPLARHLDGAFGALPADVQVVLRGSSWWTSSC